MQQYKIKECVNMTKLWPNDNNIVQQYKVRTSVVYLSLGCNIVGDSGKLICHIKSWYWLTLNDVLLSVITSNYPLNRIAYC